MEPPVSPMLVADHGPAVEMQIARDLAKHAGWVAPVVIGIGAIGWGYPGAASAAYGLALVTANFLFAAWLLKVTARISLGLMMGAALFGYLLRLALIFVAVYAVRDASWVAIVPLGLTIVFSHLGLLFWEMRYVSATLAFPGLKPTALAGPSSPTLPDPEFLADEAVDQAPEKETA